jgi:cytoskeletal protein CcmA (bactofilin family)
MIPNYALVVKSGQSVEIPEDKIIDDDLLAFARSVNIEGKVMGDVYAFAQEINITGEVDGSIFSGAANVDINVKSVNTIWAAGGEINLSGIIEKNVMLFGGGLSVGENTRIGRDIRAYGGRFLVEGDIGGIIKGGVGEFVMAGTSGDVNIKADKIKIKSDATISGDLVVISEEEPMVEEGAIITGETKLKKQEKEEESFFLAIAPAIAFFISFVKVVCFIARIIVGIILIALSKSFVRRIMDTLINQPWKSLGIGFLGLIVIPVAAVILFIVLIGFPFGVFVIYVYTILFYLSSIFVSYVVGEKIIQLFKKKGEISLYLSFIVGIVALFILGLIPVLGFIIRLVVLLFGAGMLLIGCWNIIKEMKKAKLI